MPCWDGRWRFEGGGDACALVSSVAGARDACRSVIALLFLFPIVWTVVGAFKPAREANASPPVWWPSEFVLDNFGKLDGANGSLLNYVLNSRRRSRC